MIRGQGKKNFVFTNVTPKKRDAGVPPPPGLPKNGKNFDSDAEFKYFAWNAWHEMYPLLLNRLEERLGKELSENNKEGLFQLAWKNGQFSLITQKWAADMMNIEEIYIFNSDCPFEAHGELVKKLGYIKD